MKVKEEAPFRTTVVARVAGEDIKQGDYVTVLSEIVELPSFLWSSSGISIPADEPVRTKYLPTESGDPFKVVAVCLPFVYVEGKKEKVIVFDTRQKQLVRLDPEIGRLIWKRRRLQANRKKPSKN